MVLPLEHAEALLQIGTPGPRRLALTCLNLIASDQRSQERGDKLGEAGRGGGWWLLASRQRFSTGSDHFWFPGSCVLSNDMRR